MKYTAAMESVLRVFLAQPNDEHYGWGLMERTGLPSGTLYPILDRLARKGWLENHWDTSQKPRKQYRITATGIREATEYLSLETLIGRNGLAYTDNAAAFTAEIISRQAGSHE